MSTGDMSCDLILIGIAGIAWVIDQIFFDGQLFKSSEESEEEDTNESPFVAEKAAARQGNQMRGCAMEGCNSLTFRSTEYCWKHQDGKPHASDGRGWWEEDFESQ
ncbi:MAG TPA: hypothetical protein QF641_04090 [Candidatus Thalassarchaeaceae archaeon]|nr:hypothetical protein [Candidatus Thalassarchaeaceae archaeon]